MLGLVFVFVVIVIVVAAYFVQPFDDLLSCVFGYLTAILVDLGLVVKVWIALYARKSGVKLGLGVLLRGKSKLGVRLEICES